MDFEKVIKIVEETDKIFFNDDLRNDVSQKGDADFVTKADIAISDYLHKRLKEEFPNIGFMSEEEETECTENEFWILDPIDGTTNFMHELGLSAVSLGYCSDGEIPGGIVYIPYTKQLFHAYKGKGAYLNGEKIYCSKKSKLSDCLAEIELNPYFKNEKDEAFLMADKLFSGCQDLRVLGSAAISLAYIACGKLDVFFGRYLKPWDYAAAKIIIEEAGGRLGGLFGEANINELKQHIVASNRLVFDEVRELLK